ncbi:MAG: hypothetical protein Q7R33_07820, partial [Nitrosarchaeum sp.]|nr:hypothetical protein [Nitrosarchaeum sp.]
IAKDQLQDWNTEDSENIEEPPSEDIGCDLNIFADRCEDTSPETFSSIGSDFKDFIETATCNFPEFDLIKSVILATPDNALNFVGKGYCEHTGRQVDDQKPCEIYSTILANFKAGLSRDLPCPPPNCTEFASNAEITSKCINPVGFCQARVDSPTSFSLAQVCRGPNCSSSQGQGPNSCFHKPTKDLYCARIGVDIQAQECTDENFGGPSKFNPGWTITTNSKGNEYCVPSNISQSPLTATEIAEDCEVNFCHNQCAIKFGFTSGPILPGSIYPGSPLEAASKGLSECHLTCDADAGRYIDCSNPRAQYFSNQCCAPKNSFITPGGSQFSSNRAPISKDIQSCLCTDQNNFDENGFTKQEAISACINKCPSGYENDPSNVNI